MPSTSQQMLMLSVGAAALLNLAAVRLGSSTLPDARAPAGSASPRRVEWVDVMARPRATRPPEPRLIAAMSARVGRPRAEWVPPSSASTPVVRAEPEVAGHADGAVETRFYRSTEVEQRAEPQSDWNLDTAALDSIGVGRLVFDVYVDRDGRISACHIREPEDLADDIRQRLEMRLRETAVSPAIRLGASAASVQRIEVSVLPTGP